MLKPTPPNLPPLLDRVFFARPTETVAREVLGKTLVTLGSSGILLATIVEAEAYLGEHDAAAHARFGRTARTQVLYGEPGHAYVYSIHGHNCLNFVAEPLDSPGCVLIRAVQPSDASVEAMRALRDRGELPITQISNGPGKLCKAMGITLADYGANLLDPSSPIQVREALTPDALTVIASPRVGITGAADWPLRFTVAGSPFVSPPRPRT